VFSDGITEALNPSGDEFGEERLLASICAHRESPPSILLHGVLASVREFIGSAEQSDDLTALVLRYTGS
jgi:sigma-B regulation protein RsbU (phosphoserine phosphatase)